MRGSPCSSWFLILVFPAAPPREDALAPLVSLVSLASARAFTAPSGTSGGPAPSIETHLSVTGPVHLRNVLLAVFPPTEDGPDNSASQPIRRSRRYLIPQVLLSYRANQ
ncbi:unnamed protein product [Gadus morhua 'NCC']